MLDDGLVILIYSNAVFLLLLFLVAYFFATKRETLIKTGKSCSLHDGRFEDASTILEK